METTTTSTPARILIVDDHPNTASMLARVVQKMDSSLDVQTALNAEDALARVGGQTVDVLITDFMMPGMNGLELVERFKGKLEPSRAILITAYDTPGLAYTARRSGVQHYLVKPVQPDKVKEIVGEMLDELRFARRGQQADNGKARPFRILIADDYPDNVRLLAVRLKSEGYEYLTAMDGEEALAKIRSETPDLVLLDVNMPKKDGFQVLAEMRADPDISHLPVIIITAARISSNDVREGLTLGADDYITKPVDWRELVARIRSKLRVKQAEDALRRRNRELSVLPEIGQDLSARLEEQQLVPSELVEQVLLRTVEALGAADAYAAIFQPDGSVYERAVKTQLPSTGPASTADGSLKASLANTGLCAHVVSTRQGIIIEDSSLQTRWELPLNGDTRSAIAVPLLGRKNVIGVLTLTHDQPAYFRKDHLSLLQAIAGQAAIAIENAQLYQSEHKRVQELVALNQLSRQISSFTQTHSLMENFPGLIADTLGYPLVTLWLNETNAGGFQRFYLRSQAGSWAEQSSIPPVPAPEALALGPQQVANTGRPAIISGTLKSSGGGAPLCAAAAVPLFVQDQVAGVLAVHSPKAGAFQESDRILLETLSAQIVASLERIRLFESVQQEQRKLSGVLRSAADAILLLDDQDNLQLANPAGQRLFTDISAQIGQPLPARKGYDELLALIDRSRAADGLTPGEIAWPDGRTFSVSITTIDDGGRVAVLHDVSHFKALDQLKNEFLATASHDLKNPIFSVLGFSDLLTKAGPLNEMQMDFLQRIRGSAQRMQELVLNLLEMARMEMGIQLNLERLDLNELLTLVADEFGHQAQNKNQCLQAELAPEPVWVSGDRLRLLQVCRNLVGNAIKYTPDGGTVTVSSQVENGETRVAIQDTGIGIPAEALPNLFQKFYRVHSEQTENIEGNGLGLAIVKSIVERHNGDVSVTSVLGKGSTFFVTLPRMSPA